MNDTKFLASPECVNYTHEGSTCEVSTSSGAIHTVNIESTLNFTRALSTYRIGSHSDAPRYEESGNNYVEISNKPKNRFCSTSRASGSYFCIPFPQKPLLSPGVSAILPPIPKGGTTMHLQIKQIAIACLASLMLPGSAVADIFKNDTVKLYGDFRTRLEQDWDSQNGSGNERDDRLRARVRVRLGLAYTPSESIEFGLQLRSGSDSNHQSPHITVVDFEGNDTGDMDFNFSKWYFKAKSENSWVSAGRNSLAIWKANEMFWDSSVTPIGLAAGTNVKVGEDSKLGFNGGYFSLPAGMKETCGNMAYGQAVLSSGSGITAAVGLFDFDGNDSDTDPDCAIYARDNGQRDYMVWVANLQSKFSINKRTLKVGVDLMQNTEDYALSDTGITAANQNETDGWDAYVTYGDTKNKGDWLVGYWYANIEELAVNASFSQDDFARWSSSGQARITGFKGHELRGIYQYNKGVNVVVRFYAAEAIDSVEDGKRIRMDFNYKF